ncbi:MAG: 4-(cytidine 5'-diphospho)-2-C-methyl-D-erythritol kinase, partial [Chlorobi bacterium]|nr:4-(cytidine 5'-diphospho)-2-C-methyl-D-erythritol kinase [Chlorobiota bacterium]
NDFEEPVFDSHPELAAIKEQLYAGGAVLSLMSGSGSTIFGLFEDRTAAVAATDSLSRYNSFVG